ncbi:MAG TPA: MTAP family purine nucleoside phosphorylase [Candidatus Omnitrophota bacterium]|nr:MTAP family purine nucleoside phosphorylase [Candidatus Omnitrophota bacterium]
MMKPNHKIAVIGGTGMDNLPLFKNFTVRTVITKYGIVKLKYGHLGGRAVIFMLRHGARYCAPHQINWRANMMALLQEKVDRIVATAACGSLRKEIKPGELAVITDFIDLTRDRIETFEPAGKTGFFDMSEPYDDKTNRALTAAAKKLKIKLYKKAVYACTEGPRFETKAEIRAYRSLGADVVGMTQVPEVVLATEAKIPYSAIAVVTNYAAGMQKKVSGEEVTVFMRKKAAEISRLLAEVIV